MNIKFSLFCLSSFLTLLATGLVAVTSAEKVQVGVGDEICIAGYIMDYYCIERGTLLDNPRIETLGADGPVEHSVHCLIDVKSCYESPFEVLMQLENSTDYGRAWRLDNNDDVITHAKANGVCRLCQSGNSVSNGHLQHGYRITMKAQVTSLGEAGSTPATIQVNEIHDFDQFDTICEGKQFEIPNMIVDAGSSGGGGSGSTTLSFNSKVILHGGLMIAGWGFLLPLGAIVAKFGKHRADAWWFKVHRIVQPVGLLVAIISWIYALRNFSALEAKGVDTLHYPHAICGIITMVIGSLQPLNAFVRPHPANEGEQKTSIRFVWEIIHKGLGWICIFLAFSTIGMGITLLPPEDKTKFQIIFGIAIAVLFAALLFLLNESIRYKRNKLPIEEENGIKGHD